MSETPPLIVDAQVHIWRAESPDNPWAEGGHKIVHQPEPLTYQRILGLMDEAGVQRALLVPPSWEQNRLEYSLQAAAKFPQRFAVIGRISLDQPEQSIKLIPGWKNRPGLLGMRVSFVGHRDKNWLKDGTADWFWPEVERAEIPVMVHGPESMAEIGVIARRHPGLRLIIDHMGVYKLKSNDPAYAAAIARTVELARYPNVHVKLTSLPFYSVEPAPHADLYPYIKQVVTAFGARRAFWGSDISKLLPHLGYRQCIDHILSLDFLSDEDKAWILGKGIIEFLDWK